MKNYIFYIYIIKTLNIILLSLSFFNNFTITQKIPAMREKFEILNLLAGIWLGKTGVLKLKMRRVRDTLTVP